MSLVLHTETTIDSTHYLEGYEGKCKNYHGHTWLVKLWFEGNEYDLNKVGIMVDFGIVKELKEKLDHKIINDVLKCNPTAENLSIWVYTFIKKKIKDRIKVRVRIYETAVLKKTWCEYGDDIIGLRVM